MRLLTFCLALALLAPPLLAQEHDHPADHAAMQRPDPLQPQGDNLTTPASWVVRLDQPKEGVVIGADAETADIFFVHMTPGWHVTTGPAAIFYHPASTAEGTYRAETLIHLFDPKGRNEAFGLFLGGQGLDGTDLAYDYFLIRNNGDFLIKRRQGAGTEVIHPWTASDAIVTYGPDAESSVANRLAVEVGPEEVAFFINGTEVARHARAEVATDGVVGLRVNHALNLHIEDFQVTPADG